MGAKDNKSLSIYQDYWGAVVYYQS